MAKKRKFITRRRLKWVLASLFVGSAFVLLVSIPIPFSTGIGWKTGDHSVVCAIVGGGNVWLGRIEDIRYDVGEDLSVVVGRTMAFIMLGASPTSFVPGFARHGMDAWITLPFWLPLLLIAAPTAWLWRTDRRAKPWQCAKCRYDLRGLVGEDIEIGSGKWGTVCPECGTTKYP